MGLWISFVVCLHLQGGHVIMWSMLDCCGSWLSTLSLMSCSWNICELMSQAHNYHNQKICNEWRLWQITTLHASNIISTSTYESINMHENEQSTKMFSKWNFIHDMHEKTWNMKQGEHKNGVRSYFINKLKAIRAFLFIYTYHKLGSSLAH